MLVGRFWLAIPVLAIAGLAGAQEARSVRRRARCPRTRHSSWLLLVGVVILVGALTFIPALALGPIVEHLQMIARQ